MLTVYGVYRSRATRPIWLLTELGVPFRHVPVTQAYRLADPAAADAPLNTASAEFLAINPMGQIPALVDGDLVLTESLGMTLHLAKTKGGDLGAKDAAEDALMVQWALFALSGIEAPALAILYAYAQGRADTDEGKAEIAASCAALQRPMKRLEGHLTGRDWMVGDRFTAADINLAECLRFGQLHKALWADFPAVTAWLARCQARPAFKTMMDARNAEPA
jgi:glutathione S-transferase